MSRIRILHVVGQMHRAGIESWLMDVLRRLDRDRFQFDVLVHTAEPCAYDDEIQALGSRLYRVGAPKRSAGYLAALDRALGEAGPADIVHSHEHQWSGLILRAAQRRGAAGRIAHCHNDTSCLDRLPHVARYTWRALMRRAIRRHATRGLACSEKAAPSLFGDNWRRNPKVGVLEYGFDFERFRVTPDVVSLRAGLGIPPGRFVVGHVGRFEPQKNHVFLLAVAEQMRRREANCHFLLVGDGALHGSIGKAVEGAGLGGHFTLAGSRADVPQLLLGAMDCFLFPSLHEGLPLALIEAQAAGLPCLYSNRITEEANLFPETNQALSLASPPGQWAGAVLALRRHAPARENGWRIDRLNRSRLAIGESVRRLQALYQESHAAVG